MHELTIDNTMGVMFVGLLVATALWGVSCAQMVTYAKTSREDPALLRLFVAAVWLVDTASLVLFCVSLYFYLITHFNNIAYLLVIPISLPISVPFLQATGTLVQGFYAYRIWRLSERNIVLAAIAIFLIACETALGVIFTVWTLPLHTLIDLNAKMGSLTIAYSTMSVVADWYLAGVMCWLFVSNRSRSRVDSVLHRLIIYTVTSGLLPSLCALAIFFAHIFDQSGVIYLAPFFCVGKLYVLSLLGVLNMRRSIRAALVANSSGNVGGRGVGLSSEHEGTTGDKPGTMALGRRILSRRETTPTELELSVKIDTVCESVVDQGETSVYSRHASSPPGVHSAPVRKWARRFTSRSRSPQRVHEEGQTGAYGGPRDDKHSRTEDKYAEDALAGAYPPPRPPMLERISEPSTDASSLV